MPIGNSTNTISTRIQVQLSIVDFHPDLHESRRIRLSCDLTEIRRAYVRGGTTPHHAVQRIESLPAQFAAETLPQSNGFRQRHVFVVRSKAAEIVIERRGPHRESWRQSHESRIDVVVREQIEAAAGYRRAER